MSPRRPNALPEGTAQRLRKAAEKHAAGVAELDDKFRREVRAALKHGSVRQVAEAAGLSPTTVQKWKDDA